MNLRNYTSEVSVDRSVSLIERELVNAGAMHISKPYDEDGNLAGIMFQIPNNGRPLIFKLPVRWKTCFKIMMAEVRKPLPTTEERVKQQAQRTAWKILYEWTAIQVSLIKLEQADVIEVFLPYAYDPSKDQTFFERLKAGGFKQLSSGAEGAPKS